MKVITKTEVAGTGRQVYCPIGGFVSHRLLLESDNMGFSMTITEIPVGDPQIWHYKNHLEACYCIKGRGELVDLSTFEKYPIVEGTMYALDKNDRHEFTALEDTTLVCVFNPPLKGREVHKADGSYERGE